VTLGFREILGCGASEHEAIPLQMVRGASGNTSDIYWGGGDLGRDTETLNFEI